MKKILSIFLLLNLITVNAFGQSGGKAEPNEIKFKRGSNSATIKGSIKGDEQAEYSLVAKKKQIVEIKLESTPADKTKIKMMGPDSEEIKMNLDGGKGYSYKLLKDGEYFISISNMDKKTGKIDYSFVIYIK
jgi:hypothetical protein